jgi:8-oxo-dGTP pyrophosphatase MutT (NUDIX family)
MNSSNSAISQVIRRLQQRPPLSSPPPQIFSKWSTPAVPHSAWCSEDFMLGAGMVIIQPSTHRLVILYDTQKKRWFLPKGRKDLGESLEQAALREAYEEVGHITSPFLLILTFAMNSQGFESNCYHYIRTTMQLLHPVIRVLMIDLIPNQFL